MIRVLRHIAALIVLALLLTGAARAHQAPSGARYLPSCCSGEDCKDMPTAAVEELGGGHVRITFKPGSHPMWKADRTYDLVLDYGPEHRRAPLDGDWHACMNPDQRPLCYHPPLVSF